MTLVFVCKYNLNSLCRIHVKSYVVGRELNDLEIEATHHDYREINIQIIQTDHSTSPPVMSFLHLTYAFTMVFLFFII